MLKHPISAEEARQLLDYNPKTGAFTWRVGRRGTAQAGSNAGSINTRGRPQIKIYGKRYLSHRLAWLITYGAWPKTQIDHINGQVDDNRLVNLRLATQSENLYNTRLRRNNTSGFKGVVWRASCGRWQARITVGGDRKSLGHFLTPEEAYAAYCRAAAELHGDFANVG